MFKNKKNKNYFFKKNRRGVKGGKNHDACKLDYTLTQEEYAHDVSFSANESPARATYDEFEEVDENSDHSCDFNSKSSFKRMKSGDIEFDETQENEDNDAFDLLLNEANPDEPIEVWATPQELERNHLCPAKLSQEIPSINSSITNGCESQHERAEVEVVPPPSFIDQNSQSVVNIAVDAEKERENENKILSPTSRLDVVIPAAKEDMICEDPSLEEVDRILMEAEENAKRKRLSQSNSPGNVPLIYPPAVRPKSSLSTSTSSIPVTNPPMKKTISNPYSSHSYGQESTPIDDDRNRIISPLICRDKTPIISNSNEPNLDEVDRLFMEASETSKRKRQNETKTTPVVLYSSYASKSSNPAPIKPSPSIESQPQYRRSTVSKEPSVEEVDRLLMEAEEAAKRKRQNVGPTLPTAISSNSSAPYRDTHSHVPPSKFPNNEQRSKSDSHIHYQNQKSQAIKQIVNNELNPTNIVRPQPSYPTSMHNKSTVNASKENEKPVITRSASEKSTPYPNIGTPHTTTTNTVSTTRLSQKIEISYDTISLEDFAAIEELEQFAFTQRNPENPQSGSDFYASQHSPRQSIRISNSSLVLFDLDPINNPISPGIGGGYGGLNNGGSGGGEGPIGDGKYICRRYVALEIEDIFESQKPCKNIICTPTQTLFENDIYSIFLCDDWYHTDISPGDFFHILDMDYVDLEASSSSSFHSTSTSSPLPSSPPPLLLPLPQSKNLERIIFHSDTKSTKSIKLNSQHGMIIVLPDILISPTKIADACACMRRAVINSRMRGLSCQSNSAGTLGNLKHQFFETMVTRYLGEKRGLQSEFPTEISKLIFETISDHLEDLYCANISDDHAYDELNSIVPSVINWIRKCSPRIDPPLETPPSLLRRTSSSSSCAGAGAETTWDEIVSTEETVWCPTLGIRGQVDLIVTGKITESENKSNNTTTRSIIPVELKTGRWRLESLPGHRAQIILYLVMIMIRDNLSWRQSQGRCPSIGLLLYLGSKDVETKWEAISPSWSEIRALIQVRNTLAYYLKKSQNETLSQNLPPLQRNRTCESCFYAAECMTYHHSHEKGTEGTSGVPMLFQYLTKHITHSQTNYFLHWDQLINLESSLTEQNQLTSLWASNSELQPNKLLNLIVTSISNSKPDAILSRYQEEKGEDCTYVSYCPMNLINDVTADLREYHSFQMGETVHVSILKTRNLNDIEEIQNISQVEPYVASGTVVSISQHECIISFKQITARFKRMISQSLQESQHCDEKREYSIVFRLQGDDYQGLSSSSILRSNTMRLLLQPYDPPVFKALVKSNPNALFTISNDPSCLRLRDLIIDLIPPHFQTPPVINIYLFFASIIQIEVCTQMLEQLILFKDLKFTSVIIYKHSFHSGCFPNELYDEYCQMNCDQQQAVVKVLSAQDYVLLLGMPGSGKTSTISFIVRVLIARGERVLITSYTHSAVDNIIEKLKSAGVPKEIVGRIGTRSSVRESVQDYLFDSSSIADVKTFKQTVMSFQVIGCTVLTASRSLLMQTLPKFDWCVVDECGQISQPATLGALMRTQKFLLVGDEYQLPPIVLSLEAQSKGMNVSLFKRLAEAHPEGVVCLNSQYRMNEEVMSLSNHLIYDNRLVCGSEEVATARMKLPTLHLLLDHLSHSTLICKRDQLQRNVRYNWYLKSQQSNPSPLIWLRKCLDPDNCVVFLNTDTAVVQDSNMTDRISNQEISLLDQLNSTGQGIINPFETLIIHLLIDSLECSGVDLSGLGVVTPYRAQVKHIEDSLRSGCIWHSSRQSHPVISTVDKFQGRDMDIIIISTVRCNSNGAVGDLLRDWRRVNVAITRARFKIIFVGSLSMMEHVEILRELSHLCRSRNSIVSFDLNEFIFEEDEEETKGRAR